MAFYETILIVFKGIFLKAFRIINAKFPRKSTEFHIIPGVYHGYQINKMENEAPKLTDINNNEVLVNTDENSDT